MIKEILTALHEAKHIRKFVEYAETENFWTPQDGQALVNFFLSGPGSKMRARLNNMVFKSAIQATSVTQNGEYARGIARGVMLTVKALDQHMLAAKEPEDNEIQFRPASGAQDAKSELEGLALR